ncbi:hypothetical protein OROHE_007130 [Orobanche hederae]
MVNHRCHYHSKNLSSFRNRNSSFLSLTLYVILLCALSVFIFMIYSKDVLDDEHTIPLFRVDTPESKQQISTSLALCHCNLVFCDNLEYFSKVLLDDQLWEAPFGHGLHPCVKSPSKYIDTNVPAMPVWDRYLTVRCNGGLNQMRTGIADMVAVARIMNATLVIPQLDKRSFWQDTSTFSNIFDELHFIKSLQQDVRILSELPKELESLPRARKHFTLWSGVSYYEEMIELWKEYQVIHVAKSDSRLANNDLPFDIQRLRCLALFHALHFSPAIEDLGKTPQKLVERLRSHAGRYIALHLRYEKDILSFSGCTYGLTDAESEELKIMR